MASISDSQVRIKYHQKRLRAVKQIYGNVGVATYSAQFPEARKLWVQGTVTVSNPLPAGYDAALCNLVDRWFTNETELAETNIASVERLNLSFHPRKFDARNHFSKPLGTARLAKLAKVFESHGAYLDTAKNTTMSQVRKAAKAAKAQGVSGRPFAGIGYITGDQLTVGDHAFRIEDHSGNPSIRMTVNGSRVRLRLDALAEFIQLAGIGGSISNIILSKIEGELARNPATGCDAPVPDDEIDPLALTLPENRPEPRATAERSPEEPALNAGKPQAETLSERMVRMRADRLAAEIGSSPNSTDY